MKVKDYEKKLKNPLKIATIMLLIKKDKVLLAMKKRGFGVGKWNGTGGKVKDGESIADAAIRETIEEINVTPLNINKVAVFKYYFPLNNNFGLEVHAFTTSEWTGTPLESEEMRPKWFNIKDVPYNEMWWDDKYWMPLVFSGKLVKGSFMFGENDALEDYYLDEVKSFND